MIKSKVLKDEPLRRRLPTASSLIVFESAARLGSFTAAAAELRVTQAAVTRQIKRIEEFVGEPLFKSAGRGKQLTPAGQALCDSASLGLEGIAASIDRIRERSVRSCITVMAPLSFVCLWLLPRLQDFIDQHPEFDVRCVTMDQDLDPQDNPDMLTIRFGHGRWPHLDSRPLFGFDVFPVCSPAYLKASGNIADLGQMLARTLLDRESEHPFAIRWNVWLSSVGAPRARPGRRLFFNQYQAVLHAALSGHGIALAPDRLVRQYLDSGELIRPVPDSMTWPERYHLLLPHRQHSLPGVTLFIDWLLAQCPTESAVDTRTS